ncbi:uncharacterized protein LOC120776326 [Bactrocera tryoni]|uniref:uncharacterized protein LOC120776326 n=1 Tax=Bactrocera tryoni TaxID=59916 RepID=UPI001A9820CF|nr:uncharacterized protein LOC120776326 [Bactrocera tryoni]
MCTKQAESTLLPSYLNEDFIKNALESHFKGALDDSNNNKVEILECQFERATAEGENFCSVIYRARVQFRLHGAGAENSNEKREITVIVKDVLREIAELGSNELAMYKHVLPEMQKILEQAAEKSEIGDAATAPKFYANCYFCERNPREIYVLEDLNDADYRRMNRFVGLDLEETKVVLKKLAIFHAASMKYIEKFPTESAALMPSTLSNGFNDDVFFNAIVVGGITAATKVVAEWENFEEIANKMRSSVENFDAWAKRVMRPERCRFNVITHGDLWANNVLMKYAIVDGKRVPQDAVFVDFQLDFVGSCGYDLNFFLNTSVQLDVLKLHRYELLRHYYAHLKKTLQILGTEESDIPSWQVVLEEVRDLELASYFALTCELPLCCMDRQDSVGLTLNSLIDPTIKEEIRKKLLTNKRVLEMLRYGLDRLNELGVLDL